MLEEKLLKIIGIQNEIASAALDLAGVMKLVVRALPELIPTASGGAVEIREGENMVNRAASGTLEPFVGLRMLVNGSLSGLCATTGKPLYAADTESDPRVDRKGTDGVGARSMICYPLVHGKECVGVFKAVSKVASAFSDGDIQVLSLVSSLVAAAMQHASSYQSALSEARTDVLTDLSNRRKFDEDLQRLCDAASLRHAPFTLVAFDLDGFKNINDLHGHGAGDLVLQTFGTIVTLNMRGTDSAYRIGGDEFAVLMPRCTAVEGGRLVSSLREAISCVELGHSAVGCSFGVTEWNTGDTPGTILSRADDAMYENKVARRSTCG